MRERTYRYCRITRCRPNPPTPPTLDEVLKQTIEANARLTLVLAGATEGMTQMARRLADVERRVAKLQDRRGNAK